MSEIQALTVQYEDAMLNALREHKDYVAMALAALLTGALLTADEGREN